MDHGVAGGASEFLRAQTHIYRHIFSYISSMSLKCAVQLGIPDIIHNHKQPITLPELVSNLQIPPSKITHVHRLMRVLVYSGFFAKTGEQKYDLTPSSRFLIRNQTPNLSPFVMGMLDPGIVSSWHCLGEWFRENERTPFEVAHGMSIWDRLNQDREFNALFNQAMASDSQLANLVVKDCKPIFEGLSSLVDVGGGTGTTAKIIREAFPKLRCTVLDLPHVVADKVSENDEKLSFVGGDMFQSIPSADAILLKLVMHAFSDEDCVKVLKRCREAISARGGGGKVIIIDIVVNEAEERELIDAKLYFDMLMMVVVTGKERTEKEWEKLFLEAGFKSYKITPMFGLRSLIEVFP